MNNKKHNKKTPLGIWTPKAEVLCFKCHGKKIGKVTLSDEEFKKQLEPIDLQEGKDITSCCRCGEEIQIYKPIAVENELVLTLRGYSVDANLAQTGGMNSSVEIKMPHNRIMSITFDEECNNEWFISFYDEEYELEDENFTTENYKELLEYIFLELL